MGACRAPPHRVCADRRALAQALPPPPARVLDCGGGPGRYAIELAQQGYAVTLFDLSPGNLALARTQAAAAGVTLAAIEQGDATDLGRFAADSFDAVLLMGPLYHLLAEAERRQALAEAVRVLAPGGPLLAAFLARYAAHIDAAAKYHEEPIQAPGLYETIEATGLLPPSEGQGFVAYFARPDEAVQLCWDAGLEVQTLLNVEGLISGVEHFGFNAMPAAAWDWWEALNWRLAAEPSLLGAAAHYLAVTHKPRWRTVLPQIAQALDAAGVRYRVVGGTALALHGAPLAVKDVDIELTADDAYRFGALFAAQAVEPVAWKEGAAYRSHFGRFDFAGVTVEVMGDLQRREHERWRPTATVTEVVLDLAGVPVHVATLEEETLAAIRRGRLDRAAMLLPRCDHAGLLALLAGSNRPRCCRHGAAAL